MESLTERNQVNGALSNPSHLSQLDTFSLENSCLSDYWAPETNFEVGAIVILTLAKSQNGEKKSGLPPRNYISLLLLIMPIKQLLTISINILKEKQAINPGKKKFKEEIGLESLDTSFLHSASLGSGSTVCTGEKAHDRLCHTANSEQADERLHLTPELHYDTDGVDII